MALKFLLFIYKNNITNYYMCFFFGRDIIVIGAD